MKLNPEYDAARFLMPLEANRPSEERTLHIFHHEVRLQLVISGAGRR